jgi:vacuolar-type H+-ATPase subunit I/STV1
MPSTERPNDLAVIAARKYQIFVSSTFTDLIEERRAVTEVILSMNHIPVGMELFEAGNEDQWSYIKNRIQEVDYYLVIVAERYGSTAPDGLSYTEMEYRYAEQNGVPVAALLLDHSTRSRWPRGKIDFENEEKLEGFRRLCQQRVVSYWSDIGSLTTKCQLALNGLFRRHRRAGWVSGEQAVSPQLASELARLSEENANLREQLSRYIQEERVSKDTERAAARLREPLATELEKHAVKFDAWKELFKNEAATKVISA